MIDLNNAFKTYFNSVVIPTTDKQWLLVVKAKKKEDYLQEIVVFA